jgi:galactokinase/mevalonate kinase-like predicted kinase
MKAFAQFCERSFRNNHDLVHIAHNIEAEILNTPTGTQDYYPAISGGINILKYDTHGISQQVLEVENSPLARHFLLVYTGKAHHSGLNNFEVMKGAVEEFEEKSGVKVHPITDIDSIFNHLKTTPIDGKLLVSNKTYTTYQEYMKKYGAHKSQF